MQDGSNTVAKHLRSRWGASFFTYCMREGEPTFLFLDGKGMIVTFMMPPFGIFGVDSVWFLHNSVMSVFMVRMGGIAGA